MYYQSYSWIWIYETLIDVHGTDFILFLEMNSEQQFTLRVKPLIFYETHFSQFHGCLPNDMQFQ